MLEEARMLTLTHRAIPGIFTTEDGASLPSFSFCSFFLAFALVCPRFCLYRNIMAPPFFFIVVKYI